MKFDFQRLFKLVTYLILTGISYWVYVVYQIYHVAHKTKPESLKDYPVFSEIFWIPLCTMFALFVVKYQIQNVAKPVLLLVGKDRNDEELLKERVLKASLNVYKVLYYSTMTIVGYLILKDTDILPPWLGGSGALENAFKDYPY